MTRTLIILMSLFSFMTAYPAYAGETKDKSKCSTACCVSENCTQCQAMCEKMLEYCKDKGGKHADAKHLNIMKDCIVLCKACADLSGRNSEFASKLHKLCAEACSKCAKSCKSLKDEKLDKCIEACKTCSKSCLKPGK